MENKLILNKFEKRIMRELGVNEVEFSMLYNSEHLMGILIKLLVKKEEIIESLK